MMKLGLFIGLIIFSIYGYSHEIQSVWDLASLNPKEYESIFQTQTIAPYANDFRGQKFNGFILFVANREIGSIVYKLYTGEPMDVISGTLMLQTLTFQKRFYLNDNEKGESGINFWPMKGEESLPMRIYISPSFSNPALDSLKIDYDVKANDPLTQRILIDEVRQIPFTNLYLGKMYYRILGTPHFFLWFVLERRP